MKHLTIYTNVRAPKTVLSRGLCHFTTTIRHSLCYPICWHVNVDKSTISIKAQKYTTWCHLALSYEKLRKVSSFLSMKTDCSSFVFTIESPINSLRTTTMKCKPLDRVIACVLTSNLIKFQFSHICPPYSRHNCVLEQQNFLTSMMLTS